jgi:guanine deaminase
MVRTLYHGAVVHSLSLDQLEILPSALLCVSEEGVIDWVEKDVEESQIQEVASRHGVLLDDSAGGRSPGVEVISLGKGEFLCPGLVDTHTVSWNIIIENEIA